METITASCNAQRRKYALMILQNAWTMPVGLSRLVNKDDGFHQLDHLIVCVLHDIRHGGDYRAPFGSYHGCYRLAYQETSEMDLRTVDCRKHVTPSSHSGMAHVLSQTLCDARVIFGNLTLFLRSLYFESLLSIANTQIIQRCNLLSTKIAKGILMYNRGSIWPPCRLGPSAVFGSADGVLHSPNYSTKGA